MEVVVGARERGIRARGGSAAGAGLGAFLVFVLALIVLPGPAAAQYFTIDRYHADITLRDDASFRVQETISVTFDRSRHGIYREIPYKYVDELGKGLITPIRVHSVMDETGRSWKYEVHRQGNIVNIRIGDAKRYVDGRQTYVITYTVENALLFFDDRDELYWNVTGNHWKAPIRQASAEVTLPSGRKSGKWWASCYTGVYGSGETQCGAETSDSGGRFFTKRTLNIGEGLTVALGWEKGLIAPPPAWKKLLWAADLRENGVFIFPFLSLGAMILLWFRKGRDPRVMEAVRVMYEPPKSGNKPLSPAEVGTLIDEKADPRDITSSIVGLAVRGYIAIEEVEKPGLLFKSKDYYLQKLKEPDNDCTFFEDNLLRALIPAGLPGLFASELKNRFYAHLEGLKKALFSDLVHKKYFPVNPEKVRGGYVGAGIVVAVFGTLVTAFLNPDAFIKGAIAMVLAGLPVMFIGRYMPSRTRAGAAAYTDLLGFREFLNRAEKDRIERLGGKDLFYKYLPYAIALDVVDHWTKAFDGISLDPPSWYVAPGGFHTFSPHHFSQSMTAMTSSLSSALFSAPRGSGSGGSGGGSSGGGSSGGGFGGGGGGSW
jgi:uncharacterized membrane protein YgcG